MSAFDRLFLLTLLADALEGDQAAMSMLDTLLTCKQVYDFLKEEDGFWTYLSRSN